MSATANEPSIGNSTLENVLYVRERIASARFIPIPRGDKAPRLKDWPHKATRELEMLELWFGPGGLYEGFSFGVCNVVAIDVDVKNGAAGVESFRALDIPRAVWGTAFRVKTPSGGHHVIYSLPDGAEVRSRDAWRPGIDIKAGLSGQVVGPGCVSIRDGVEVGSYIPMNDAVAADCPRILLDLILADQQAVKERAKAGEVAAGVEIDSDVNIARARAYLADRKGSLEGNRDNWTYQTACGVIDFGISAELCFELLAPWNLEKNVPPLGDEIVRTKCDSAWRTRTNLVGSASIEAEFVNVKIPAIERTNSHWFYRHGDTVSHKMRWLLYRRLPLVGTAMIVGPSGGGKTFFLADLARAIAKAESFFGDEPDECGGVALFAAEGVAGMSGRLSVLGENPLPIWAEPVANLRSKEEQRRIGELLDAAQSECLKRFGQPLRLIGIDTLAASGLLEDENDNSECSEAVKLLELLAMRYQCLVAVTHHPPKTGTGARGGSALHAGFDTVVEIHHDGKQPIRRAECTKSRDAPTGDWGCFKLEPHVLGLDVRGREETTCTLIVSTAGAKSAAATFLDPKLVDSILEAVGNKTWRMNEQSGETTIIDVIAKCAGLDPGTSFGLRQSKESLLALLAIGALEKGVERIGGKNRPIVFAATNPDE